MAEEGDLLPEWKPENAPDHPYYDDELYSKLMENMFYAEEFRWKVLVPMSQAERAKFTPQEVVKAFDQYKWELRSHYCVPKSKEFENLSADEMIAERKKVETGESSEYLEFRLDDYQRFSLFDVWANITAETDDQWLYMSGFSPAALDSIEGRGKRIAEEEQLAALVEEAMLLPDQKNPPPPEFLAKMDKTT